MNLARRYTLNGKIKQVIDANGNRAELRYDGHDRQSRWVFPAKTRPTAFNDDTPNTAYNTAGALEETDYEEYAYDAGDNRISLRKRDGWTITYLYDALNRMTKKTLPARTDLTSVHRRHVFYSYDLRDLQTSARFSGATGQGIINTWDALGRQVSTLDTIDNKNRTVSYQYDVAGRRTQVTYPDSVLFTYEYDTASRLTALRDQSGTALVSPTYDNRGLLSALQRPSGTHGGAYTYDPIGRLGSIGIAGGSSAAEVTWSFTRNPASQILTESQTNDAYSWDRHQNKLLTYTINGLNQYEGDGVLAYCYDANGNLTADGGYVYLYDLENRLVEMRVQGAGNTNCAALSYAGEVRTELRYDPLGRLYYLRGYGALPGITRFAYDGDAMIAEYNNATTLLRRYVHGSNAEADDPLVWYEGTSVASSNARHLHADPRGSIVLVAGAAGQTLAINTYDEYGIPDNSSGTSTDIATKGRFRYTGQAWLPELGMYYYKARVYSPRLGRFLQTDPIGYKDQFNLYAYVGNDPVNGVDPDGLERGEIVSNLAEYGVYRTQMANAKTPAQREAVALRWRGNFRAKGNAAEYEANRASQESTRSLTRLYRGDNIPSERQLEKFAKEQGWKKSQTEDGPAKYSDENGVVRLTIKHGSDRAPGSDGPHIEYRDAEGQRRDPKTGRETTRKSEGNHRPH